MDEKYVEEFKKIIENNIKSGNVLENIFLTQAGPNINSYNQVKNLSDSRKWYLFSEIDKYMSISGTDKDLEKLVKKYGFTQDILSKFSFYNKNINYGYKTNTYGLNVNSLPEYIRKNIELQNFKRQQILNFLSEKGIKNKEIKENNKNEQNLMDLINFVNNNKRFKDLDKTPKFQELKKEIDKKIRNERNKRNEKISKSK
jgi:hypothetical protein